MLSIELLHLLKREFREIYNPTSSGLYKSAAGALELIERFRKEVEDETIEKIKKMDSGAADPKPSENSKNTLVMPKLDHPAHLNNRKELAKAKSTLQIAKAISKPAVFIKQGVTGEMLAGIKPEKLKIKTDDVVKYVLENGTTAAAKHFKVSSQAISYHMKKHNDAGS